MNRFFIIIILSVLGLTVLLFIINSRTSQNLRENNLKEESEYLYFCRTNIEIQLASEGYDMPDSIFFIQNKDSLSLINLSYSRPILIFRHSNLHCKTCVDLACKILNECFDNFPEDVVLLYSSEYEENIKRYKRVNRMKYFSYNIKSDTFSWLPEVYNNPYFFVLYPNGKVSNFFMPHSKYPEITKKYLEGVRRLITKTK